MNEDEKLQDEWARAQRSGRAMDRKKMIAAGASVGVTFVLSVPLIIALIALNAFDDRAAIGIAILALMVGWYVRKRLWPTGQFSR